MSEERQTDVEGLVRECEQAAELACRELPPEEAAWMRKELVRFYRHRLELRTPQEEFANFAQRLKNRQGTQWADPQIFATPKRQPPPLT